MMNGKKIYFWQTWTYLAIQTQKLLKSFQSSTTIQHTVVSHVGGRPFWMKNFKCIFLVSLASLGAERSGKIDFRTPEAQKTEKMLSQMGSYVHFTV